MALVAVQRSSCSGSSASSSKEEAKFKMDDGIEDLLSLPCGDSSSNRDFHRHGSLCENFFAMPGAALILPKHSAVVVKNLKGVKTFGGELQTHLQAIFHHLRSQDSIKLAVRLESWDEDHRRYLVIITTNGRQDTEESIIVGCDFETRESTSCTIGLVLPLWCDTDIRLDGDGGFRIENKENRVHIFKPVSVQAMWSALQSLHRCVDVARRNNYYEGSLYLTWTCYYTSKISSDRVYINEWSYVQPVAFYIEKNYFQKADPTRLPVEKMIRNKLKAVMMTMDLDNCTAKQIRLTLEGEAAMDLTEYKKFIDTEMLVVLGQMDCSSRILDFLYLGSEWNACNLEELEELGITHILNVTNEIDRFYPDNFRYMTVPVDDEVEAILLPYWNHTWRFIEEAKKLGGKCLVHCKKGVSRSSATVCAYLMKSRLWKMNNALEYVRARRSIIQPNSGFMQQLIEYEGIIFASAHRHNKLFRWRSESSLSDEHPSTPSNTSRGKNSMTLADDARGNCQDFDLNRRLLDITNCALGTITRAKSWSPDEGWAPHRHSNNHCWSNHYNWSCRDNNFHRKNLSEPADCLLPSSGDPERNRKLQEKRKNFFNKRAYMRRHTMTVPPRDGAALVELALSEDSVFVHDSFHSTASRRMKKSKLKSKKKAFQSPPTSIPDVPPPFQENTAPPPSSVPVNLLKSRFSSPMDDPSLNDVTNRNDVKKATSSGVNISTSIPVREIVAVIESPADGATKLSRLASGTNLKSMGGQKFTRGHYKTASLPPSHVTPPTSDAENKTLDETGLSSICSSGERSLSESQSPFSVKKIVTAIESGNLQDSGGDEEDGDNRIIPFHGKKVVPPSSGEEEKLKDKPTSFFVGQTEAPSLKASNWCASANTNNNNNNSNITCASPAPLDDVLKHKRPTLFPSVMLRVIEKVGLQLLANTDDVMSRSSVDSKSTSASGSDVASGGKIRGVRQMVREIEKGIRRLSGHGQRKSTSTTPVDKPMAPSSDNTIGLPLSTGSASDQFDMRVRSLVDRFDTPSETSPVPSPVSKFSYDPSTPRPIPQRPTDLLAPQPYRSPNRHQPTLANLTEQSSKPIVRRSQSDRIGVRASVARRSTLSRSFRTTRNPAPLVSAPQADFKLVPNIFRSPPSVRVVEKSSVRWSSGVRGMVSDIERLSRSLSSSSLNRSSSLPSSGSRQARKHKILRKSKSSSCLDNSCE